MNKYKRQLREDYLLIILIIISSSNVTSNLSSSLTFLVASFIYITLIYIMRGGKITKSLMNITMVLSLLSIIYYFKFSIFHPLFTFRLFVYVYMAFMSVKILKLSFLPKLVNIVYILSLISLPLYSLQLVSFSNMFTLIESIQNSIPFLANDGGKYANILIWGIEGGGAELRNCGFMWEPGAFAAILLLPIMFELSNNKFKINMKLTVMIIALLTTLSTMGYIGLIVIFFYYYYNIGKNVFLLFLLIPISLVAMMFIIQLPFIKNKVLYQFESANYINSEEILSNKEHASFGRIGSAIMDYETWKKNPILGIGGHDEAIEFSSINKKNQTYINRTNGDTEYLVRFGVIGVILFLLFLKKSFKLIAGYYKVKGYLFFIVIILTLGFSNTILFTPLLLIFQLHHLTRISSKKKVNGFTS